jgi:ABC-type Fe3+-siderophore transport system permease subunit
VLSSQWASGASWSLVLICGQVVSCGGIFLLSLRRGVGGVSPLELALLGIAALGVVGWQVVDDPAVATCSVVAADLIAVGLMLPKTFRNPRSETLETYVIGVASTVFALAAVGSGDLSLLIYPLYLLVADGAVAVMIFLRRRAVPVPV